MERETTHVTHRRNGGPSQNCEVRMVRSENMTGVETLIQTSIRLCSLAGELVKLGLAAPLS
jgi:hypothetical protein